MTALNFEAMTTAEVEAALAALRKIKKDAQDAEKDRYAELARDFIETVLTEHGTTPSDFSDRVGYSTQNLSIEVDGRAYTFYVAIKDVKASEARKDAIEKGEIVVKKKEPAKSSTDKAEDKPEPVSLVKE